MSATQVSSLAVSHPVTPTQSSDMEVESDSPATDAVTPVRDPLSIITDEKYASVITVDGSTVSYSQRVCDALRALPLAYTRTDEKPATLVALIEALRKDTPASKVPWGTVDPMVWFRNVHKCERNHLKWIRVHQSIVLSAMLELRAIARVAWPSRRALSEDDRVLRDSILGLAARLATARREVQMAVKLIRARVRNAIGYAMVGHFDARPSGVNSDCE